MVWKGFPAFPAHLRMRPVSRGNSRRATWVGPHAERKEFHLVFFIGSTVKRLPAMRETRFDSWVGKVPWRTKWQSTPALLPGKSHGRRGLIGYSPWGCKESDTTKRLHFFTSQLSRILLDSSFLRQPPPRLCPWDFPSKNTGVGSYSLLQGSFPTQGLNPGFPHCR